MLIVHSEFNSIGSFTYHFMLILTPSMRMGFSHEIASSTSVLWFDLNNTNWKMHCVRKFQMLTMSKQSVAFIYIFNHYCPVSFKHDQSPATLLEMMLFYLFCRLATVFCRLSSVFCRLSGEFPHQIRTRFAPISYFSLVFTVALFLD